MKHKITVENSVPSQTRSAQSVRWASQILAAAGARKVAEFGSGRFRNATVLKNFFDEVFFIETEKQFNRFSLLAPKTNSSHFITTDEFQGLKKNFHAVFLISVLHTVPRKSERKKIIEMCHQRLKVGGKLVIDVPQSETYYNRKKATALKYKDGWLMKWGDSHTFYKSYYAKELDDFVTKLGFSLLCKTWITKHLIRIYQKSA